MKKWETANLLQLLVGSELDGAVRDDTKAIYAVTPHEALEPLLVPHAHEAAPYTLVRLV